MMTNKQRYAYGKLPQYKSKFIELPYTASVVLHLIILLLFIVFLNNYVVFRLKILV